MIWIKRNIYNLFIVLTAVSCIDPYEPPALADAENYLVIEGFLNAEGPTVIDLSRTAKIIDGGVIIPESNAQLSVESEEEIIGILQEAVNGRYTISELNVSYDKKYRLRIITSDGNQYLSRFIPVKESPPIQDVFWEFDGSVLEIFVNTTDPEGDTRYYRWEFEEAWEFNSFYQSQLIYSDGELLPRAPSDDVYTCWKSDVSSNILTTSTRRLGQDIVYRFPLTSFKNGNLKLSKKYSILVKQHPLTKEGYEFFELLKSNSEELGSFFDPQPGQIRGNFYSTTNPNEIVIGYLGAGSIAEKRIYIENDELELWSRSSVCENFEVTPDSIDHYFSNGDNIPLYALSTIGNSIIYVGTRRYCGDCTVSGTKSKPLFWE